MSPAGAELSLIEKLTGPSHEFLLRESPSHRGGREESPAIFFTETRGSIRPEVAVEQIFTTITVTQAAEAGDRGAAGFTAGIERNDLRRIQRQHFLGYISGAVDRSRTQEVVIGTGAKHSGDAVIAAEFLVVVEVGLRHPVATEARGDAPAVICRCGGTQNTRDEPQVFLSGRPDVGI